MSFVKCECVNLMYHFRHVANSDSAFRVFADAGLMSMRINRENTEKKAIDCVRFTDEIRASNHPNGIKAVRKRW